MELLSKVPAILNEQRNLEMRVRKVLQREWVAAKVDDMEVWAVAAWAALTVGCMEVMEKDKEICRSQLTFGLLQNWKRQ